MINMIIGIKHLKMEKHTTLTKKILLNISTSQIDVKMEN